MGIIVITGGVASGKSTAADCFRALGVNVIDTDQLARELVQPGTAALTRIAQHFGPDILTADGHLDRRQLRTIIFQDAEQKSALEALLHPLIANLAKQRCAQALAQTSLPYVLLEVPLYTENTPYPWVDRVLLIDTDPATQLRRVQARDKLSVEQARRMLSAQATRAQRLAMADDVISNNADLESLQAAVEAQHQRYLKLFS